MIFNVKVRKILLHLQMNKNFGFNTSGNKTINLQYFGLRLEPYLTGRCSSPPCFCATVYQNPLRIPKSITCTNQRKEVLTTPG